MIDDQEGRDRMGQPYRIREAAESDAQAIVDLINEVGRELVYIANEGSYFTVAQQQEIIRSKNGAIQLILVAEQSGQVVGTLELVRGTFVKNAHTATFGMALASGARNRGMGRALLEVAHEWARKEGVNKIHLSVFGSNLAAIRLYQSMGYVEEARRPDQFRLNGQPVDEVFMAYYLS